MIILNNLTVISTVLGFCTGSTKHLPIVGAMFAPKSDRFNVVKTHILLEFVHRLLFKNQLTHIASVVAVIGDYFLVSVVKHKIVIGTLNSPSSIVPVLISPKKATRRLLTLFKRTTALMRAELLRMTELIGETVATMLAYPTFRVFSKLMSMYSGFIAVPSPKSTNRGYGDIKEFTDFFYSGVFFVVKSLEVFLGNFSRFSSLHGLIIAQAIPIYKGSTRLGYAYGLKNIKGVL